MTHAGISLTLPCQNYSNRSALPTNEIELVTSLVANYKIRQSNQGSTDIKRQQVQYQKITPSLIPLLYRPPHAV